MTANSTTTDQSTARVTAVVSRLRELLRRFDPTLLGLLGFLSLPAYVFDSLAFLEVFGVFFLFFLWMFVGPLVDMALARGAGEETEPTDWIQLGGARELVVGYLMIPVSLLNPLVVVQDFLQAFGGALALVRHRGSLPDAASYDQQVSYRLPVEGTWTAVSGSPEREYSHSWIYPNQRYAYDLLVTDEDGRSHPEGTGTAVEEYYCYDEPVLAPADGIVVDTFDTVLEAPLGGGFSHPLKRSIPGGHVVIRHADSEYSLLAHLRPGSVAVEPGDHVARGQQIGRCGHSGNSSEPHLHFQVQDRPDFTMATSLPIQFDNVTVESPGVSHDPDLVPGHDVWHAGADGDTESTTGDTPTGLASKSNHSPDGYHDRTFIVAGQCVTHAGESDSHDDGESQTVDARQSVDPVNSTGRQLAAVLRRAAFGLALAGLVTFVASLFVAGLTISMVLGGAAVAGVAFRYGFLALRGDDFQGRAGALGAPLGLAVAAVGVAVAAVSGAVGVGALSGLFLLVGFLGYAAIAEYDERRLHTMTRDVAP